MIDYFKLALSRYFEFSGRSRRSEFWYFFLTHLLIGFSLGLLQTILGIGSQSAALLAGLSSLISLGLFIPGLAVSVRRLHDVGKSGWWLLIAFIPLVGAVVLIIWWATDSEAGPNRWGPNPKSALSFGDDESLDRFALRKD